MKWEFSSGGYLKVYNDTKQAWFDIHGLTLRIAWQVGAFTPADWNETLACVKEAKTILKRLKRLRRI